jgi:outer membrane autotransporter protein
MGWSGYASAAGTCGAPNLSGVVNCAGTNYPSGIEYNGADAVDDLTINVGSYAGQKDAVTVGGRGILIESTPFIKKTTSETLKIGSNASISTSDYAGVTVLALSLGQSIGAKTSATAFVQNEGGVSTSGTYNSGFGIIAYSAAETRHNADVFDSFTAAHTTVVNGGSVKTSGERSTAISAESRAFGTPVSQSPYGTAEAVTTAINSGKIETTGGGVGIYANSFSYAGGGGGAHSTATTVVENAGLISTIGTYGDGLDGSATSDAFAQTGYSVFGIAQSSIQNSGSIITSGDSAAGIFNSARGTSSTGGYAQSAVYASTTNSGAISTSGISSNAIVSKSYAYATGADARAVAATEVTNSGPLTTQGAGASAIYGFSEAFAFTVATSTTVSASATTSINNSGTLVTSGDGSAGIGAVSYASGGVHSPISGAPYTGIAAATTTVTNTGNISTAGSQGGARNLPSDGIYAGAATTAYGFRDAYATSVVNVTNSGAIVTSGESADGIYATARSKAYGATGCIFCFAGGYTIARAYATVANNGTIKTSGDYAAGISVVTDGYAITKGGSYSYDESAVTNSGAITTSGAHSAGITAVSEGVGAFRYFSNADVSTVVSVNNSGAITTTGDDSPGLDAISYAKATGLRQSAAYANVFITNSGDISTKGMGAGDIVTTSVAYSTQGNGLVSGTNYITNTGALTTTGAYSVGISSLVRGYSTIPTGTYHSDVGQVVTRSSVGNSGSITTSGERADGIDAFSTALAVSYYYSNVTADATVSNSGAIKTTGDYSSGIVVRSGATNLTRPSSDYWSQAIAAAAASNAGSISVRGNRAAGIAAFSYALAFGSSAANASATTSVINTGSISASAQYANGISAGSEALVKKAGSEGTVTAATYVVNAGSITAKDGTGIFAYATSYDQNGTPGVSGSGSATASVLVKNVGTIVAGNDGILAQASFNGGGGVSEISTTATVENTGSITVTGDGGEGIGVGAGGIVPGTASVVNTGTVSVLGADSAGVAITAYAATVVNAAGGLISASGAGGIGVGFNGAKNTLATYTGSNISGGTDTGVGVYMYGVLNVIANSGTITSASEAAINMTAYGANVIKNSGAITGTVTMTTGAKGQNVFYNYGTWNAVGGNSSFTHGTGGGSNLVNEKGGTIVAVSNQTFEGLDAFTNLGLITMTQAASAGIGLRPAFETLTVSGDYVGVSGSLAVDASTVGGMHGDELKVDGAASGSTKVIPTIVGTPGATAGDGILLVSAHTTTGANDFVIAGNAANGDEVAGAFEYDLAFDPGPGTSGKWYLQSSVYPGVYQFGQVQSAAALVSDQVNPSLDDLMNQAFGSTVANASLVDTAQQVASNDPTFVPAPNGPGLSGWGRFDETRFNVDPSGSPFADYKLRVDSMQIGLDGTWHNAGNLVMFGGYITPFHAWSDFSSFGGHIGMSGTAYGLYGLWFSGPWQAGLRLNTDNATAHISDTFIGTNASVKPYETGAQAAMSYDMPFDWADFTPSAEFNYGTVNGVHFTDGAGSVVQVGSTDDLWGKLNGRFSWDVETAHNLLVQPYVNVGLLYRGDTDTRTTIGTFSTSTNVNGWDGDFAAGVNTNLATSLSLSAQADYLAGDRVKGWTGFIGLRYTP